MLGSSAALGIMTVISVCIGSAFSRLPDAMTSSIPIGQYLGAALMLLFGVRTIYVGHSFSCRTIKPWKDGRENRITASSSICISIPTSESP